MLVHICCSVDSHFFLEKLQADFPQEKLTGFFYDPNIHPYSEYRLRYLDVQRSCKKLGIELLEGEYDFETWMQLVRGLEKEPEKGKRCEVCFDRRFEVSALKALEMGETKITTTLLVSPLKSQEQLKRVGDAFFEKNGVEFIAVDYRSGGGSQDQSRVTKEEQLYRQDYCGCIYGLSMQREQQDKLMDEMFSPIGNQILPASIEERLELYARRMEYEDEGISYQLVREKFLNYRQFNCKLSVAKKSIDAHALIYSTLPRKKANGNIEHVLNGLYFMNREEVKFITLAHFNLLTQSSFKSVKEMIFSPLAPEREISLRRQLCYSPYDLSPIFVVDAMGEGKIDIYLDAVSYEDNREYLLLKSE
ncbi:MAG: epoxyqueuosine reductase QueH [Campylobacterales bacterium]|nr:epoxyqueuosine reductase QueH [Campylobacterales bacterium]